MWDYYGEIDSKKGLVLAAISLGLAGALPGLAQRASMVGRRGESWDSSRLLRDIAISRRPITSGKVAGVFLAGAYAIMGDEHTKPLLYTIDAYFSDFAFTTSGVNDPEVSHRRLVVEAIVEAVDGGSYNVDCQRGRAFAASLIDHMAAADLTAMLGAVCRGIIEAGSWKSIHAGFFQCLAERCVAASK